MQIQYTKNRNPWRFELSLFIQAQLIIQDSNQQTATKKWNGYP